MKRLFLLLLTAIMLFSFIACGKTETPVVCDSESAEEIVTESKPIEEIKIEYFPDDVPTGDQQRELLENNIPERMKFEAVNEIEITGMYSDNFPIITNDTPLDEITATITNPYIVCGTTDMLFGREVINWYNDAKDKEVVKSFSINTIYNNIKSDDYFDYNALYTNLPLDFLRKTDVDGWYYSVAKFNTGYLYSFFGPIYEDNGSGTYSPLINDKTDLYFYGSLYAENVRSYNDFENIKIGSSINDVVEVDSTAKLTIATNKYYRLSALETNGEAYFRIRRSYHLLKDGILVIAYEPREIIAQEYYGDSTVYLNNNDDLVVCAIHYYPDYNYVPKSSGSVTDAFGSYYEPDVAIPIHILPQDYPPAN